jgi:hydrogenase maturation factor
MRTGENFAHPSLGKIRCDAFVEIIQPRLGSRRSEVAVGPRPGVDTGIVELGHGAVMAVTVDPLFIVPEFGWERAAWFAIQIAASDAAASGLEPAYAAIDLNLPLDFPDSDLRKLWESTHTACVDLGLAIIAGHTGRYEGCAFPIIGSATVMAVGTQDRYVTSGMAQIGDSLILTKGAAIEATAVLGAMFPETIAAEVGPMLASAAGNLFGQMSVVKDARVAASIGVRGAGVTSMHDATESGVWNALWEIADASCVGLVVEQSAIVVRPETRAVCDVFGIDPYTASSEGTLVITCRPDALPKLLSKLQSACIDACRIGEVRPADRGVTVRAGGSERALEPPFEDGFWPAYRRAQEAGWR